MMARVITARAGSIADAVGALLCGATAAIDVAVYRFGSERLARALAAVEHRGVRVRLVVDRSRYVRTPATRDLLHRYRLPYRLATGRNGADSKMHHKFAVVDDRVAVTGSYNWTDQSESEHWENIVILSVPEAVGAYRAEFEALWAEAADRPDAWPDDARPGAISGHRRPA